MFRDQANELEKQAEVCLKRADAAENAHDVKLWMADALELLRPAALARDLAWAASAPKPAKAFAVGSPAAKAAGRLHRSRRRSPGLGSCEARRKGTERSGTS
jgi:hypothetical protein